MEAILAQNAASENSHWRSRDEPIGHFLATSQAAPVMLSLRHTPDDEAILTANLDKFERWSAVRTTLQVLTFFILICALIVAR